jgi:hypothetical protein
LALSPGNWHALFLAQCGPTMTPFQKKMKNKYELVTGIGKCKKKKITIIKIIVNINNKWYLVKRVLFCLILSS